MPKKLLSQQTGPDSLRLPEALRDRILGTAEFADAAAALTEDWAEDQAPPTAAELAGATALQSAIASVLSAHYSAHPDLEQQLSLHTCLDAVLDQDPALAWLAQIRTPIALPSAAATTPGIPGLSDTLEGAVLAPIHAAPDDLSAQLTWILDRWKPFLTPEARAATLHALDLFAEERRPAFHGPGPTQAPGLGTLQGAPGYSTDAEWMPGLVLHARHALVWLAQLSRWTGRAITRLDQIPEQALMELRTQGITGLWLVGIWERSQASRAIKRHAGQTDAEASAYALDDYRVSRRLGGEEALESLRHRCERLGLVMCADMVPNHTGLDSRWVAEHPDWFVQSKTLPFAGYTFEGPDLSDDPRFTIRIEDGYWRRDDAAVVFQRVDHHQGTTRWIYHGNDGTTMPWNDTAQLDICHPQVRAALIETIVDLAQRFGALRFDAAMTLARKHVRRLWYPDAGGAGAIPSRAGRGMDDATWHQRMPREFWEEVVEAVRERAPNTLLLAEAFWMMEVDFARSFGLHRVYWSAFRDWVRDGEHAKHRAWLKDALAKEPQLLQRLCLFLSNPDEESAAAVFGTGERYLVAATLQAVLPGLVLIAHGQVDGLEERYGMEFSKPRTQEVVSLDCRAQHLARIRPLLERRKLFGRAAGLRLFDLTTDHGAVAEAVYAIANRHRDERALVLVNASSESAWGRIHQAAPTATDQGCVASSLVDALGLERGPDRWVALRDQVEGLWYLRAVDALDVDGLTIGLGPWQCQVFLEIRELVDTDGRWAAWAARLDGRGATELEPNLEQPTHGSQPCRSAGVLLHPTSLPGPEGVGTLGRAAHDWISWLAKAGCRLWQVLPLCAGGPGHSPYSSPASGLGNPILIDLAELAERGWLTETELGEATEPSGPVDFDAVWAHKRPLLEQAADRLIAAQDSPEHLDWLAWRADHPALEDAVLFAVLKAQAEGAPWWTWPAPLRDRQPDALADARHHHAGALARVSVAAWWFDRQWRALRTHAEQQGIAIIGDLPIYVARDSADVWADQSMFELGPEATPLRVAGVPPDAFAEDGQLWGNPLYAWLAHAAEHYRWWVNRFRRAREWTPILRIDHFRGFSAFYAVDGEATDARSGTWEPGPGAALFRAVDEALGPALSIAEDLGEIDDAVHELRHETHMLGTRVAQFGLGGEPTNLHHPEGIAADTTAYTGTHDNDTTAGWFAALSEHEKQVVATQLDCSPEASVVTQATIEAVLSSAALWAIIPVQDLLGLGSEARMNTPGTPAGNWSWRLTTSPTEELAAALNERLARARRGRDPSVPGVVPE